MATALVAGVMAVVLGLNLLHGRGPTTGEPANTLQTPTSTYSSLPQSASPIGSASAPGTQTPGPTAIEVAGETPDPEASSPAGAVVLPGYTLSAALKSLEGSELECESSRGGMPGDPSAFILVCAGNRASIGYSLMVQISYWALDRVAQIHVVARALDESADPPALVPILTNLIASPFDEADRDGVADWFATAIASGDCTMTACERGEGAMHLFVDSGAGGARGITIYSE